MQQFRDSSHDMYTDEHIQDCLNKSLHHYKKAENFWGQAITYFIVGYYKIMLAEVEDEYSREYMHEKG